MIPLLPKWVLTNKLPAFYDMESGTAIEQTAKIYGAMQELVTDYNKFAEDFNKTFEEYVTGLNSDHECFQNSITKIVHDYIGMLDEKLKMQDKEIEEAVLYMKDNLSQSITDIIVEMKEMGELDQAILNAVDGIGERFLSLETRATDLETRATDLETRANDVETGIETLTNTDTYLTGRISTLETKAEVLTNTDTSLTGRISTLETKAEELTNTDTSLTGRISTLETNIPTTYKRKDDVNVLTGEKALTPSTDSSTYVQTLWTINYPTGFSKDNCIVCCFATKFASDIWAFGDVNIAKQSIANVAGSLPRSVTLQADNIQIQVWNTSTTEKTLSYKIVLMKI